MMRNPHSRSAFAVAMPSCRYAIDDEDSGEVAWLRDPVSGSWARISSGVVHQSAPRRLWDEADAAYWWWPAKGRPLVVEWEWEITPNQQRVSLPR